MFLTIKLTNFESEKVIRINQVKNDSLPFKLTTFIAKRIKQIFRLRTIIDDRMRAKMLLILRLRGNYYLSLYNWNRAPGPLCHCWSMLRDWRKCSSQLKSLREVVSNLSAFLCEYRTSINCPELSGL